MDTKKDWSLRLAVALPFAMILFVAASIYLPRLWAPVPEYDFVYIADNTSNGYVAPRYNVRVIEGRIVKDESVIDMERHATVGSDQSASPVEPHLYRYNASNGESAYLTFEEAEKLKLDDNRKSPDGFEVLQGGGYDGPFGGGSKPAIYLIGHSISQKLDLRSVDNVYGFEFIGWVVR